MVGVNIVNSTGTNKLYENSLKPRYSLVRQSIIALWTPLGFITLLYIGFAEPFSNKLFEAMLASGISKSLIDFIAIPVVMLMRAIIVVESIGYFYHRFFQHLGFLTRTWQKIRRNQKYHWIHHMVFYPIGKLYKRKGKYVGAEPGIPWSWLIPITISIGLVIKFMGVTLGSFVFILGALLYIQLIRVSHDHFHKTDHAWTKNKYFNWLENIHILHHWDQGTNYTIVNPAMDVLFGTFMNPKAHPEEVKQALQDYDLSRSDIINWRYLLTQATPAEYAAFISAARQYPAGLRKVEKLMSLLEQRIEIHKTDSEAKSLITKATECLKQVNTPESRNILKALNSK